LFLNQPIRNKNCPWWPCLLMDRHNMSNLYKGPSILLLWNHWGKWTETW
jgi:hypothetical protein